MELQQGQRIKAAWARPAFYFPNHHDVRCLGVGADHVAEVSSWYRVLGMLDATIVRFIMLPVPAFCAVGLGLSSL